MKGLSKFMFWSKRVNKRPPHMNMPGEADDGTGKTTPGLLTHRHIQKPKEIYFEDANTWKPDEHSIMYCLNGQDNVPTRVKHDNGFVYYVSQNRSPGHKDQGQDCIATASHGNWQVHVLCDGHDKAGHMVALGVCQQLPKILLRLIKERKADGNANEMVDDNLVNDAFDECARIVCWTKDGVSIGMWVKVFSGPWADKPGFIKENSGNSKVKVAIIDENGYHLPSIDKKDLRRPRYTGGCTCVMLLRNLETGEYKVAVSGDSRLLVLPSDGKKDEILFVQPGVDEGNGNVPEGRITPAHNVFNESEKERLEKDFSGQYEFDGNFLVNPITKFAIQPTRGFGDFDMFGTGYTHRPEISKTFELSENGLIFTASDGVFDSHVWADEEIVSCLDNFMKEGLTNVQIIDRMYRETLERSLEGGYVDDISIYVFQDIPLATSVKNEKEKIFQDKDLPSAKSVRKKKDTRKNRKTIGRGAAAFTDISAKVQELKKQMETPEDETNLKGIAENKDVKEGIEGIVTNLAKSHSVLDKVSAAKVLDSDSDTEV